MITSGRAFWSVVVGGAGALALAFLLVPVPERSPDGATPPALAPEVVGASARATLGKPATPTTTRSETPSTEGAPRFPPGTPEEEEKVKLAGKTLLVVTVLDPGGRPLEEAWAATAPKNARSTGPDGVTRLEVAAGEALVLTAGHKDFSEVDRDLAMLAPGERREVTLRLEPGASLEGQVVDAEGRPVDGARVYLGRIRTGEEVLTRAGHFRFPSLPGLAREIGATALHPEEELRAVYGSDWRAVENALSSQARARLEPGGVAEMRFELPPLSGEKVRIHVLADHRVEGALSVQLEGPGGSANHLPLEAPGVVELWTFGQEEAELTVRFGDGSSYSIRRSGRARLRPGQVIDFPLAGLSGRLVHASGSPVPGVSFSCSASDAGHRIQGRIGTVQKGEFHVPCLPAGTYTLSGRGFGPVELVLGPGEVRSGLELRLD